MTDASFSFTPQPPRPTAWETVLGLASSTSLELIHRVNEGLPAAAFNRFAEAIGMPRDALAKAIRVSVRTVQRRDEAGEPLDPGPSERLVRLALLYERASRLIGGGSLARQWMQTPREVFEGQTPFELAGSELGAREVEDLLLRLEHGVFY